MHVRRELPCSAAAHRLRILGRALVVPAVLAASGCSAGVTPTPLAPTGVSSATTAAAGVATAYVLSGTVIEKDGGPIEGARVAAVATEPNDPDSSSTDITDEAGFFALSGLNRYVSITAEAPGYEPAHIDAIDVARTPVATVALVRKLPDSAP
jgi:hypothetical protein